MNWYEHWHTANDRGEKIKKKADDGAVEVPLRTLGAQLESTSR